MKYLIPICCLFCHFCCFSQSPDSIYVPNIKTTQLYLSGNQLGYPAIPLGSTNSLELHFDDLDNDVKSYYYSYQLCNADWTPVIISEFDYLKGFSTVRISEYHYSSIALTHYTHYRAVLPDQASMPTRSGNYLLKVFLDNDTSKLVFTRRLLLYENLATVGIQYLQPYNPQIANLDQKIQLNVNIRSLNLLDPFQQVKIVVLQNYRWDIAIHDIKPTIVTGSTLQYTSDDNCNFPGGNQWRWFDLQSLRYLSDRIARSENKKDGTEIYLKPDTDRSGQGYYYFSDINGYYYTQTTESINQYWQTDYANVHFSFVPPGKSPYADKDIYLIGKFTNYQLNDDTKMLFNESRGMYEINAFLKMGFYDYMYATVNRNDPSRTPSFDFTEGNHFETENDYAVLVYYRAMGGRADQLISMSTFNTINGPAQ